VIGHRPHPPYGKIQPKTDLNPKTFRTSVELRIWPYLESNLTLFQRSPREKTGIFIEKFSLSF